MDKVSKRTHNKNTMNKDNVLLKIDKEKCISCGTCVALFPEIFELDASGKSKVKDGAKVSEEIAKEAIDSCPVSAVTREGGQSKDQASTTPLSPKDNPRSPSQR